VPRHRVRGDCATIIIFSLYRALCTSGAINKDASTFTFTFLVFSQPPVSDIINMLEAAARRLTRRSGPNRDVGDYEPETQRSSTLPYGRTSTTLQPTPRLAGHQSAKSSPTTYLQQTDYFQSEPLQLRHPAHNTSLNQDLAPSTSREQQHPESCSCQICRTKSDANAHANYARKLGEWFSSFPATLEHINRGHDDLASSIIPKILIQC
jgi:hypothetical protein